MATRMIGCVVGLLTLLPLAAADEAKPAPKAGQWRGLHVNNFSSDRDLDLLGRQGQHGQQPHDAAHHPSCHGRSPSR